MIIGLSEISEYNEVGHNLYLGMCPPDYPSATFHWIIDCYGKPYYNLRPHQRRIVAAFEDSEDKRILPPNEFIDGLADLVNTLRKSGPVLVHCQMGLNRSALICARAIIKETNRPAIEVINELRDKRGIDVLSNSLFERRLLNLC